MLAGAVGQEQGHVWQAPHKARIWMASQEP